MTKFNQIARRIDEFRDEMTDLQIKLCSIPAIAPSSGGEGEARKGEVLLEFLKKMNPDELEVIKAPDLDAPSSYRPNILARFKGRNTSKTVWIMTHMDVVPAGDLAQWAGDPFKAWVKEGKIYGRGVEDNQQDLIASLYAIKAFQAERIMPSLNVGVVLVSDEETGSRKGIQYVLGQTKSFSRNDLIIVPDAGNKDGTLIEVAEKGILWLKFRTLGRQAHASTPNKGINSFKAASYLVAELDSLYQIFRDHDSLFEPPISTFEPTKKEANVPNINTIPGEDVFYLDCRLLPKFSVEDVEAQIRKIARRIENRFGVQVRLEEQQRAPAAPPTPVDAPVVGILQAAIKAVYNVEAAPRGIGGGTVAANFRRAGFPAACWSRLDETAHQPNEYCWIDNMTGNAKVFAHVFMHAK